GDVGVVDGDVDRLRVAAEDDRTARQGLGDLEAPLRRCARRDHQPNRLRSRRLGRQEEGGIGATPPGHSFAAYSPSSRNRNGVFENRRVWSLHRTPLTDKSTTIQPTCSVRALRTGPCSFLTLP